MIRLEKSYLIGAFNFAISIVLAYWLALSMNWDLLKYSALAIVLISLDSTKASIQKGLLRIIGTIAGVFVGFIFLCAFAQERFDLMIVQALYLFFIAYFMQLSNYWYAWYLAGFVPFMVWSYSYSDETYAFYYGVFRFLETISGIIIYTLVSLLFPFDLNRDTVLSQKRESSQDSTQTRTFLINSLYISLTYIVAFIFWIYIDPPQKAKFLGVLVCFALITPKTGLNMLKVLFVFLFAIWFIVAPFYFLLMPALTSGYGLLIALFVYSFVFGYLGFYSPALKIAPMVVMVMTTGITNTQQYSFTGFANGSLTLCLALFFVAIMQFLFLKDKNWKTVS